MKKKNKDTVFRMYKTKGPNSLLPIYQTLQQELNLILSTPTFANALANINLKYIDNDGEEKSKLNGVLWKEISVILGDYLKDKIPFAWYIRILYHNIISLLKSRDEQVKIYEILKANQYKINNTVRDELAKANLYPTNVYLKNLAKTKTMPTLPKKKTFILDFSVSDKQMFRVSEKNKNAYEIKIFTEQEVKQYGLSTSWLTFDMYLPTYIREEFTGETAKPQFYWDNNKDEFVCAIPCKIRKIPNNYQNILGVDLGKIKVYSATVLCKDGSISDEYVPTPELKNLGDKLNRINEHINLVYEKKERSNAYGNFTERQQRREIDYKQSRKKRTKLQFAIARLVAVEVINIAIKEQCKEIHLEKLNWVNNSAGKWNFSQVQSCIEDVAELFSIKVFKVNATNSSKTNPVTLEVGSISDRVVKFTTGEKVDRDQLASLNLALRQPKVKKPHKIKTLQVRNTTVIERKSRRLNKYLMKKSIVSNLKSNRKIHQEYVMAKLASSNADLIKKEGKKIVLFSHNKANSSVAIVAVSYVSNSSTFFDHNVKLKHILTHL